MRPPFYAEAMNLALEIARDAMTMSNDVPVGAVIFDSHNKIVSAAPNSREASGDPTAHAEINAIREAGLLRNNWRLDGMTLVVTLEPCAMCAGAIVASRLDRVVFGAWDPKAGAAGSVWDLLRDRRLNHRPEVIPGVEEERCAALLTEFFASHRD